MFEPGWYPNLQNDVPPAVWSDPSSQYFTGSVTSPNQGY